MGAQPAVKEMGIPQVGACSGTPGLEIQYVEGTLDNTGSALDASFSSGHGDDALLFI